MFPVTVAQPSSGDALCTSGFVDDVKFAIIALAAHWRHLANTVERLCAAAMSGSVARRPVPKLLRTILFSIR